MRSASFCSIFILALKLFSYTPVKGEFEVIGSPDKVLAIEGDDVVLPCHVNPPDDMFASVLEWSRLKQSTGLNHPSEDVDYVFIYRDTSELLDLKTPSYFGRTSLLGDGLRHGNMSLKISNVTLADSGRYRCCVPTLASKKRSTFVSLSVIREETLLQNNTKTSETSPRGGSSRRSSISILLFCIAIVVQMLI